jgi:hypothetical protein
VIILSVDTGREGDRRRKSRQSPQPEDAKKPAKKRGDPPEVGNALRSVYDSTLNETIPPEMLDLLGKLG